MHHSCLGEIAVVALGHDRNDDAFDSDRRIGRNRCRDGAVVDTSHGVRRREVDGRADRPPLRELDEARHLAGAVQDGATRGSSFPQELGLRVREDGGDAGAGDPAAFGRLWFVAPHRHVTDRNPGTSVMAFCAPGAKRPMRTPCSRRRGPRADGGVVTGASLARYARPVALGIPLVWTEAHRLHDVREDTWVG